MLLGVILRRIWRERRLMGVLLVALSLVTAFMALGPLYVRAIAGAELEIRLNRLTAEQSRIDLNNALPFDAEQIQPLIDAHVAQDLWTQREFMGAAGLECGFYYNPDDESNLAAVPSGNQHCYQPFAYPAFDELFTLADGKLPEDNEEIVEAVITRQALNQYLRLFPQSMMGIGSRFVVGEDRFTAATIEIVGIVETILPQDDPFWTSQDRLFGIIWPVTINLERIEFSPIVRVEDFQERITPAMKELRYTWRLAMDYSGIHVDDLPKLSNRLKKLEQDILAIHPAATVRAGMQDVITQFEQTIARTEKPIILLSGLVLVLMLYNVVTTTALILEQQSGEWAMIASRGGSTSQLVFIQFMTVAVLCLIAFLLGPLLAQIILLILAALGPQAEILAAPDITSVTPNAILLSLAAALVALFILTLPAFPMARKSLLRLRQSASRPPTRPAWARYFLDVVFLVIGTGFTIRLYFFITGEASLQPLLDEPGSLIRVIAANGGIEGLSDPFNLLGPVLVLTGLAMLCMRLFPVLMRGLGGVIQRLNELTVRLALWSVERDPGHYAQLVLLVIGTLALGTASLALTATRNTGAWDVAFSQTGADARLRFTPDVVVNERDLSGLPGVEQSVSAMAVNWADIAGAPPAMLFGMDLSRAAGEFPQVADQLAPLPDLPGEVLPEDLVSLSVDVYPEPDENTEQAIETLLSLIVYDANFVRIHLPMTTDDPTASNQFVTHTAQLDDLPGRAPWRLGAIRLDTRRLNAPGRFPHTLYLDNMVGTLGDGSAVMLNDFEPDTLEGWRWDREGRQISEELSLSANREIVVEGQSSLRVLYNAAALAAAVPTLNWRQEPSFMPVLISPEFARRFNMRRDPGTLLAVGDELTSRLDWDTGRTPITRTPLTYRVVGIVETFPGVTADDAFLIAPLDHLKWQVNALMDVQNFYSVNQVWMDLNGREPSAELVAAVNALPGLVSVEYAWDRYAEIQRDPLANSITGMLFAGFWVSLALILLDFAFYIVVSMKQRAMAFAVLRAMGLTRRSILGLLSVEQAAFITPALVIGVLLGLLVAYIILPFLALIGSTTLQMPLDDVVLLLGVLVTAFTLMLVVMAVTFQRRGMTDAMRFGE